MILTMPRDCISLTSQLEKIFNAISPCRIQDQLDLIALNRFRIESNSKH